MVEHGLGLPAEMDWDEVPHGLCRLKNKIQIFLIAENIQDFVPK
jgi:hypothetical protein